MVCYHVIHIQTEKHFCYIDMVCLTIIMLRDSSKTTVSWRFISWKQFSKILWRCKVVSTGIDEDSTITTWVTDWLCCLGERCDPWVSCPMLIDFKAFYEITNGPMPFCGSKVIFKWKFNLKFRISILTK